MFRVVLIDDEALVLKGMSMVLEKDENIQLVGTASTGPEGLDLIYKEKPDIVFTDIRMPGMTGLEMIEKAQERFPEIVYIIFSGFNEFKYVQKAIGLGVLDYLEKPVTVQDLKKSLARAGKILEYKRNYTQMKAQVAQVNNIGGFMYWGLEKDLLLPYSEQVVKVQKGEKYLVGLYIDKSDRLCATMKVYDFLRTDSPYKTDDIVEVRC